MSLAARPIPSVRRLQSYAGLTEHHALYAARHAGKGYWFSAGNRTIARSDALNAITRIGNVEAESKGGHLR